MTVRSMTRETTETDRLLRQAAEGDREVGVCCQAIAIGSGMVALRLDPRLHGRIDASDVIQEAYLEASTRLPDYARAQHAVLPLAALWRGRNW
jgi:RNA polymerase sigma-70 factor (ECF subfamily)